MRNMLEENWNLDSGCVFIQPQSWFSHLMGNGNMGFRWGGKSYILIIAIDCCCRKNSLLQEPKSSHHVSCPTWHFDEQSGSPAVSYHVRILPSSSHNYIDCNHHHHHHYPAARFVEHETSALKNTDVAESFALGAEVEANLGLRCFRSWSLCGWWWLLLSRLKPNLMTWIKTFVTAVLVMIDLLMVMKDDNSDWKGRE